MRMYWDVINEEQWNNMRVGPWRDENSAINPIIYFDMDGTLAKFNKDAPMEEVFSPGYFRNLEPHREMLWLAKKLVDLGFDVRILSKSTYEALDEKYEWLREHMPFIKKENIHFVPLDADKCNFVPQIKPVDTLIDDYWRNLTPDKWPGVSIKCVTDINTKDPTLPWVDLKATPSKNVQMITWAMLRNLAAEIQKFKEGQTDVYTFHYIKTHCGLEKEDFYSMCAGFGINPKTFGDYDMKNTNPMPNYLNLYSDFDAFSAFLSGKRMDGCPEKNIASQADVDSDSKDVDEERDGL